MTPPVGGLRGLPPHGKILALVGFVLVVVATPAGAWAVFAADAALLLGLAAVARIPPATLLRRSSVELPFLVFAALLPFVAAGPTVVVGGLQLSRAGLLGGATLAVKATLGVVAAVVLASTTQVRDLLAGLERLRLPEALVAVASFMLRYVSLVGDDLHRMHLARLARGARGGRAAHLAAVAGSAGSVFVRTYERGERVQAAMLARGYAGRMPPLHRPRPGERARLAACALLPLAALTVRLVGAALPGAVAP